ncbi:MAG: type I-E CRISPR-associated protein Cas7/Cse4/CasC [Immundisolibacter sp.]
MIPRFLQIHFLTAYPASLLNRDDAGFAKRMPFGGAVRTRISSQCQKRHWRTFEGPHSLAEIRGKEAMSVRSRYIFEQIAEPLRTEFGGEAVDKMVQAITDATLGASDKNNNMEKDDKAKKDRKSLRTNQLIVLGHPEIRFLEETARKLLKEGAKPDSEGIKKVLGREGQANLQAIGRGAGLDAALFGRMKTSDVLADCDAAVHVAHAFTVHGEHAETDYFTAVDDLVREIDSDAGAGAGHVNAAELTSGIYYGYVAVDVPLLISNLEGVDPGAWEEADRNLAGEVVERLVHLVASVSPGAKLGATAPYSLADFVAVEAGIGQPCTWANAFFDPVTGQDHLREKAVARLDDYLLRLDRMHQPAVERRYAAMTDAGLGADRAENAEGLPFLARWACAVITEGME